MATLNIPKNYEDGTILFESDLDDIRDNILTFVNVTKLNDDNIQDNGITASDKLVDGSITGAKLDSSVADGVTVELTGSTLNVVASSITTAKLADNSVTTAKINDLAITNAKIADATIEQDKLATKTVTTNGTDPGEGGVVKSSSTGSFSTSSTSDTDVTNASVTLTTTGRPVMIYLEPDGTTSAATLGLTEPNGVGPNATFRLVRDVSTQVAITGLSYDWINGAVAQDLNIPPGCIHFFDDVAAGTFTWKLTARVSTGTFTVSVENSRLVAVEI